MLGQVRSDNQAENVGEEGGKNQVREERMGRWVRLGKFGEVAQVSAGKGKWKKLGKNRSDNQAEKYEGWGVRLGRNW